MKNMLVKFNAGVEYKGVLFLSSIEMNGLWRYDLNSKKMEFISKFYREENPFDNYALHRTAFLYKNEAWFIPQNGKYIAIVDLENYKMEYIPVPYKSIVFDGMSKTNAICLDAKRIDERHIMLVPCGIDSLNIVDLETKEIESYSNINEENNPYSSGVYANNKFYFLGMLGLKIYQYDRHGNKDNILIVDDGKSNRYGQVYFNKNNNLLYIGPGKKCNFITVIDVELKNINKIIINENIQTEEVIEFGNELIGFLEYGGNRIVLLNMEDNKIRVEEIDKSATGKKEFYAYIYSNNKTIISSLTEPIIYIWNDKKDIFEAHQIEVNYKDLKNKIELLNIVPMTLADKYLGLEYLIDILND